MANSAFSSGEHSCGVTSRGSPLQLRLSSAFIRRQMPVYFQIALSLSRFICLTEIYVNIAHAPRPHHLTHLSPPNTLIKYPFIDSFLVRTILSNLAFMLLLASYGDLWLELHENSGVAKLQAVPGGPDGGFLEELVLNFVKLSKLPGSPITTTFGPSYKLSWIVCNYSLDILTLQALYFVSQNSKTKAIATQITGGLKIAEEEHS